MSLCDDIKSLLGIESMIFIGDKPDTPDNLICISQSGGYNPQLSIDKSSIEKPTFQIYLRDTNYQNAQARIKAIKQVVNGVSNQTINDSFYINILQQGDILPWGRDEHTRWEFSINFRTQIR